MAKDPAGEVSELSSKLDSVEAVLGPDTMRKEADGLRERAGEPGLWEDPDQAQAVTRRLSDLDGELARLENLDRRLADTQPIVGPADRFHAKDAPEGASRAIPAPQ